MTGRSKLSAFSLKIGLAVLSTALTLGLAELALRGLMDDPRSIQPPTILDPDYGWRWAGHSHVRGRDLHGELDTEWWTNSLGFYDVDHPPVRRPGVRRILFIGDSFTVGGAVPMKETFVKRAEAALSAGGAEWECLNLGVAGYSTGQELKLYEKIGRTFDADIVILSFCVDNDIADNHPNLSDYRPYFILRDGKLIFEPMEVARLEKAHEARRKINPRFYDRWLYQSYLWRLKRAAAVQIRARMRESPAVTNWMRKAGLWKEKKIGREWDHFRITLPPEEQKIWDEARTVTVETLKLFDESVRRDDRKFLLVLIPSQLQVYEDTLKMFQSFYVNFKPDEIDLDQTAEFLKKSLTGRPIPILDPIAKFRSDSVPDRLYYKRDFHLTSAGHRVLAESMVGELERLGWANRSARGSEKAGH